MARTLAKYLAFAFVLVLLDACGRSWFEGRPAGRHDAEVACLKSGAVKAGAGIAELRPIQGPGMCGADFPLRVTMLGEGGPLGFADDPRPPGTIPSYSPAVPPPAPGPPSLPPPPRRPPLRPPRRPTPRPPTPRPQRRARPCRSRPNATSR